jgi:hypothetical protein
MGAAAGQAVVMVAGRRVGGEGTASVDGGGPPVGCAGSGGEEDDGLGRVG